MSELAADGIPVAVTCRVLGIARQPYYRWRARPVTATELERARRANALFDAHRDYPEFGYRFLADEARDAGQPMADRTAWRICSSMGWWSAFGKKRGRTGKKAGPPVHDDLVRRDFTAIGETVNLSQRMEQFTKTLGGPILISDQTRRRLRCDPPLVCLGEHEVPGYGGAITVHRVVMTGEG